MLARAKAVVGVLSIVLVFALVHAHASSDTRSHTHDHLDSSVLKAKTASYGHKCIYDERAAKAGPTKRVDQTIDIGELTKDGIRVMFEGLDGTKSEGVYDLVLQAVGRTPNGKKIGAEKAGVIVGDRGFIPVNVQMRTNVPHIFAIGDIVGQPMLAHKAVHEAHVAAEVAQGQASFFDARQIPSVAYTDPEVAWAGKTEEQCKAEGIKYGKAVFPWAASGRAIANGRDEGFTKLIFDEATHRVIGGGIVGTHAGDLISEVCLAVEMGCEPTDIGKTIHPHPTLGESIGMTAEVFEGHCTDLPPQKKK